MLSRRQPMSWPRILNRASTVKTARPRAQLREGRTDWYRIQAKAGTQTAQIYIYDEIGYWGITASDFVRELSALDVSTIELRLNSPGGEVFDGIAIHNALVNHKATVNVVVDGMAASIASVIAMAGDTIAMGTGSQMMIHDGHGICVGNAADMRQLADMLDKTSDTIAGFYSARAGGTVTAWRDRMRAETWYTGDEAVAAGLADTVVGVDTSSAAANTWDLSIFNFAGRDTAPAPDVPADTAEDTTAPDIEPEQVNAAPVADTEPDDEAPAFADLDPAQVRAALDAALVPVVPDFDPDVFRAAMALAANDAPAPPAPKAPQTPPAAEPEFPPIDPAAFRRAVREATI